MPGAISIIIILRFYSHKKLIYSGQSSKAADNFNGSGIYQTSFTVIRFRFPFRFRGINKLLPTVKFLSYECSILQHDSGTVTESYSECLAK